MARQANRAIAIVTAGTCVLVQPGCASRPAAEVLEPTDRAHALKVVAIAPAKFDPRPEYTPYARGVAKGAGKGALTGLAAGAAIGLEIPAEMARGGDRNAGAIALLILPFTVAAGAAIGTVVGTVGGTAAAVPEGTARRVDETIAAGIASLKAPQAVAQSVMEELSRSTTVRLEWMPQAGADAPESGLEIALLRDRGADAAVDVRVQAIGFEGTGGANPTLVLIARASAKLIYVYADVQPGPSVAPVYRSAPHPYTEWAAENAKLLQEELRRARAAVADYIVEQVVLIPSAPRISGEPACGPDPLPPAAATPSAPRAAGSSGRPVPTATSSLQSASGSVHVGSGTGTVRMGSGTEGVDAEKVSVNAVQINGDRVILRWEQYPLERQRWLINGDLLDGIQDTVYDLKVWTVDRSGIPSEVYDRRGITETFHPIELSLRPGPVYYWSVRARFHYRGRDAATPWSGAATPLDPTCSAFPFPDSRRFQFQIRTE